MEFNPDIYLSKFAQGGPVSGFNPDAYLQTKQQSSSGFDPDAYLQAKEPESPLETVKAAAQGAAQGVAGPLGAAYLRAIGQSPEELRQREEKHPIAHGIGEAVGLVGGGLGKGIAKGAEMLVGSSLAKRFAVESALFSGSNELSKLVKEDPDQTLATVATHIGLSGLLGGALGKVGEQTSKGLSKLIDSMKSRVSEHAGEASEQAASGIGAKLVDSALKKTSHVVATGLGTAAGSLVGHPFIGAYLGKEYLGPHIEHIMPSLIKPLIKNETDAVGAAAASQYLNAAVKGARMIKKTSEELFKAGALVSITTPDAKDLDKLKESVKEMMSNPMDVLQNPPGNLQAYLPAHQMSLGSTMTRAVGYLNTIRPSDDPMSTLGGPRPVSKTEEAQYDRALTIAQQPLMILQHVKDGTITPNDITTLDNTWPAMKPVLQQHITASLTDHLSKEGKVPYHMVPGLSLLLGHPLDSSTMPQNMLSNNPQALGIPNPQQGLTGQPGRNRGLSEPRAKGLNKLSSASQTPSQSREQSKGTKL